MTDKRLIDIILTPKIGIMAALPHPAVAAVKRILLAEYVIVIHKIYSLFWFLDLITSKDCQPSTFFSKN